MKAYTIGIPIAVVVFLGLMALAFVLLQGQRPDAAAQEAEASMLVAETRARAPELVPPDNADPMLPTLYAEPDEAFTLVRVHGVLVQQRQEALLDVLRELRTSGAAERPIRVEFHYPEQVPEGVEIPTSTTSPEPIRVVNL